MASYDGFLAESEGYSSAVPNYSRDGYETPLGTSGTQLGYIMQAADSVTGQLFYWTSATQDWLGSGYTGPNLPTEIAVSGRTPLVVEGP